MRCSVYIHTALGLSIAVGLATAQLGYTASQSCYLTSTVIYGNSTSSSREPVPSSLSTTSTAQTSLSVDGSNSQQMSTSGLSTSIQDSSSTTAGSSPTVFISSSTTSGSVPPPTSSPFIVQVSGFDGPLQKRETVFLTFVEGVAYLYPGKDQAAVLAVTSDAQLISGEQYCGTNTYTGAVPLLQYVARQPAEYPWAFEGTTLKFGNTSFAAGRDRMLYVLFNGSPPPDGVVQVTMAPEFVQTSTTSGTVMTTGSTMSIMSSDSDPSTSTLAEATTTEGTTSATTASDSSSQSMTTTLASSTSTQTTLISSSLTTTQLSYSSTAPTDSSSALSSVSPSSSVSLSTVIPTTSVTTGSHTSLTSSTLYSGSGTGTGTATGGVSTTSSTVPPSTITTTSSSSAPLPSTTTTSSSPTVSQGTVSTTGLSSTASVSSSRTTSSPSTSSTYQAHSTTQSTTSTAMTTSTTTTTSQRTSSSSSTTLTSSSQSGLSSTITTTTDTGSAPSSSSTTVSSSSSSSMSSSSSSSGSRSSRSSSSSSSSTATSTSTSITTTSSSSTFTASTSTTTTSTSISSTTTTTGFTTTSSSSSSSSSTSSPSPSPSSYPGKRGLAYTNVTTLVYYPPPSPYISWSYNYYSLPNASDNVGPYPTGQFRFIPLLYNDAPSLTSIWQANVQYSIAQYGTDAIFGFNEPDACFSGKSACMSLSRSLQGYVEYMQPFARASASTSGSGGGGSVLIGAPAVTNSGTSGLTYLSYFLGNATQLGLQIDFLNLHWYASPYNIDYFKQYVTQAYQQTGGSNYSVWVTEFGMDRSDYPAGDVVNFLQLAMSWMDAQPWIGRYAWFGNFADGPAGTEYLLNRDGSGRSSLGDAWNNYRA